MNRRRSNAVQSRLKRLASATGAEREAARQDYIKYAKKNREIGSAPESFDKYLAEWLDVRDVKLDAGAETDSYCARDYSRYYGGRGRAEQI